MSRPRLNFTPSGTAVNIVRFSSPCSSKTPAAYSFLVVFRFKRIFVLVLAQPRAGGDMQFTSPRDNPRGRFWKGQIIKPSLKWAAGPRTSGDGSHHLLFVRVMSDGSLIINTDRGLYCPAGDFFIDAWRPVTRTIVTHAHSDHARRGSQRYLTAPDGVHVLRKRMGDDCTIDAVNCGETLDMNGVRVSLHPAGHVLGSSQVRVEHQGEVWVFTGDYKRQPDPTCRPFELVRC